MNEEEAKIVKFVSKEYSLGTIGKNIVRKLNKKKVLYKSNQKFNEKTCVSYFKARILHG